MERSEALARARNWWSAVSDTGFVPMSSTDIQSLLADLLIELSAALDAEEFDPAAAVGVGAALVKLHLTNPVVISRSADVLGSLPGLSGNKGVEFVRSRGSAMLGSFGHGYASALQRATLSDQAAVHNALAAARRAAADALRASDTRFKVVFENAAVAIGVSDTDGRLIEANPALAVMAGRPVDELPGILIFDLIHPDDWQQLRNAVYDGLVNGGGTTARVEVRYRRAGETFGWAMFAITFVAGHGERESYVLAVGEDITERRKLQAELYRQARHDPLTGLGNRLLLLEALREAIAIAEPEDRIGLCFIDLDGFKAVNDRFGHGVGDRLLAAVAARLDARGRDLGADIARIGGDEFVAVVPAPREIGTVVTVAQQLLDSLSEQFDIGGQSVTISASIGALAPVVHNAVPEHLLDAVDTALYQAKAGGGGVVYVPESEG